MSLHDISRAHFLGCAKRRIVIRPPDEDQEGGRRGLLPRAMYGTRDVPSTWQGDYTDHLESHGFRRGRGSPATFYAEPHGGIRMLTPTMALGRRL